MPEIIYRISTVTDQGPWESLRFSTRKYDLLLEASRKLPIPQNWKPKTFEEIVFARCWFTEKGFREIGLKLWNTLQLAEETQFRLRVATLVKKPFYKDELQVVV